MEEPTLINFDHPISYELWLKIRRIASEMGVLDQLSPQFYFGGITWIGFTNPAVAVQFKLTLEIDK